MRPEAHTIISAQVFLLLWPFQIVPSHFNLYNNLSNLDKCNKALALYQGAAEIWSPSNLGRDMKKL